MGDIFCKKAIFGKFVDIKIKTGELIFAKWLTFREVCEMFYP